LTEFSYTHALTNDWYS